MTALLRHAVLASALLLAAGCGSDSAGTSDPPTPRTTPTTPTGTPSPSGTPSAGLPLTITRTGGIAGFMDRVVVGANGIAIVSERGAPSGRCKVDPALFQKVTAAVAEIDWSSLDSKPPTARHPDDLVIAVAANGGIARLDDPRVKKLVDPVGKLLVDPFTRNPAPKHCRPV